MEMTIEQSGDVTIAQPRGRLDGTCSGPFGDQISSLIRSGISKILIDLRHVTYVSSIGIRALLVASRSIGQNKGALVLCETSAEVMRVFDLSGLSTLLTLCRTRDEGISVAQKTTDMT